VEKERFNYLVRNYSSLTQQETAELRAEQDQYSYCQLIRNLIARGDQDNQTEMKDMSLTVAAVYSTDRSVLKQILSEPRSQRQEGFSTAVTKQETPPPSPPPIVEEVKTEPVLTKENKIVAEQPVVAQPEEKKETTTVAAPVIQSDPAFDPDQALSKFMADLGPMREMKLKFEKAMEEFQKNLTHPQETEPEKPLEKPKRKPRASKNNTENLLEEIKTTKKKVTPENPKQIEQIEIIDQFIKAKPAMPKADKPIQTELDLTSDTDTYNENVVSETLALILIKQGKKEKAIEVLRKLIWKFPQKKAYFAAQIEDLTK
jgi:tetratricopeptide (TPR) repeat protein